MISESDLNIIRLQCRLLPPAVKICEVFRLCGISCGHRVLGCQPFPLIRNVYLNPFFKYATDYKVFYHATFDVIKSLGKSKFKRDRQTYTNWARFVSLLLRLDDDIYVTCRPIKMVHFNGGWSANSVLPLLKLLSVVTYEDIADEPIGPRIDSLVM